MMDMDNLYSTIAPYFELNFTYKLNFITQTEEVIMHLGRLLWEMGVIRFYPGYLLVGPLLYIMISKRMESKL